MTPTTLEDAQKLLESFIPKTLEVMCPITEAYSDVKYLKAEYHICHVTMLQKRIVQAYINDQKREHKKFQKMWDGVDCGEQNMSP